MRYPGKLHPVIAHYPRYPVPLRAIRPLGADAVAAGWRALRDPANIRKLGRAEAVHPNAVCYYSPPFLAEAYRALTAEVRALLGYDIVETYYYARLYGTGDELKIHTDRGSCFVSVSLCFGYEYSPMFPEGSAWPIAALADEGEGPGTGRPVSFALQPGEGILYPGCSAPHWRDLFLGARCGQAFFHWVPKDAAAFGAFYGDPDRKG